MDANEVAQVRNIAINEIAHYLQVKECPKCKGLSIVVRTLPIITDKQKEQKLNMFRCLQCLTLLTEETTLKAVLEK